MYTDLEKKIANSTSRSAGAVGQDPLVYRQFRNRYSPNQNLTVLDFGAGRDAVHTKKLRDMGYNICAHEFGENQNHNHNPFALTDRYNVVLASNVLNVQSSIRMLNATLSDIANCVRSCGCAIVNYPRTPRKMQFGTGLLVQILLDHFEEVTRLSGNVFICERPI